MIEVNTQKHTKENLMCFVCLRVIRRVSKWYVNGRLAHFFLYN